MAVGTFAGFARAQSRRVVLLVELTAGLSLTTWTKTGGFTFVYQVPLSRFEAATSGTRFGAGVYRKCVGLAENDTDLVAVGSIAAVDATASRFFWDEAAGILYAHSSTGSSPNVFTSYMALVRYYLSNEGIVLNLTDGDASTGVYYYPWLAGGAAELVEQVEDVLTGSKQTRTGELAFTNGHRWWHAILANNSAYVWKNKSVQILVGGSYDQVYILPRSAYVAWSTMLVEDSTSDEVQAVFTLKPLTRSTEQDLPVTPYFSDSYPNLGDGVSGTHKPVIYGRVVCKPDLTDKSGNGVYTVADAAFQTLFGVNQVVAVNRSTLARTTLSVGVDYTVDLTACTITIVNATYVWSTYDLEADVTGKPGADPGTYLKLFADIVEDILRTFLGVTTPQFDAAAFAKARSDAPQELAVYLKSPRSIASVFNTGEQELPSLERSVMGTVQQTLAGLWTVWVWKPGIDPATALALRKQDFARFTPQPKLETVYSSTRTFYGFNAAQGTWANQVTVDNKTKFQTKSKDTLKVYTFLTRASDALTMAQRYQLISGAVSLEVEFEERGAILATARAGDKVLVTFDPAPDVSGKFTDKPMELLQVQRSLVPVLRMAGRLGDLRGFGEKVGTWQNVGGAGVSWAAATDTQRRTYGFWTDVNGYIVPADESTRHRKIWW